MSEFRDSYKEQQKKDTLIAKICIAREEGTLGIGDLAAIFRPPGVLEFDSLIRADTDSTVQLPEILYKDIVALLGAPGSAKSALLAQVANDLTDRGVRLLALKADRLPVLTPKR